MADSSKFTRLAPVDWKAGKRTNRSTAINCTKEDDRDGTTTLH